MNLTAQQKLLNLFGKQSVLRSRDLAQHEIPRVEISRLCKRGVVQRIGRGLYRLTNTEISEHQTLAEVSKAVPNGVVCLLSALRFHDLTTQAPFEVWMAIDVKAHHPKTGLPLKFVRFSGPALSEGVEVYQVEGVEIRVYCLAKTIADCFKYRNKIGLDVALETLREAKRSRRCTIDDLWRYAKVCRVSNVMRPYLEALAIFP
jgi:predicted transcriptional regulator of viral defense system